MPDEFDGRLYVRIDHSLPENKKVAGLSDAAFRLYIEAICWCSRQESDGRIPHAVITRMGTSRSVNELARTGLLDDAPDDDEYAVHDYLKHQRSREEIETLRKHRRASGSLGNHVRWHVAKRRTDPDCEWCLKAVDVS